MPVTTRPSTNQARDLVMQLVDLLDRSCDGATVVTVLAHPQMVRELALHTKNYVHTLLRERVDLTGEAVHVAAERDAALHVLEAVVEYCETEDPPLDDVVRLIEERIPSVVQFRSKSGPDDEYGVDADALDMPGDRISSEKKLSHADAQTLIYSQLGQARTLFGGAPLSSHAPSALIDEGPTPEPMAPVAPASSPDEIVRCTRCGGSSIIAGPNEYEVERCPECLHGWCAAPISVNDELAQLRAQAARHLIELDVAHEERATQRDEIARLREQLELRTRERDARPAITPKDAQGYAVVVSGSYDTNWIESRAGHVRVQAALAKHANSTR